MRKDKGGAGYKSMGGGGGKSNGNAAQPSRLTMSRLEQVPMSVNDDSDISDEGDGGRRRKKEGKCLPAQYF